MRRSLSRALIVILPVICLFVFTSSVMALGIGIAPSKMEFSICPGETGEKVLHVINQASQESEFRVYIEGEKKKWFTITPGEFMLNAQETKNVEISITPPLTAEPAEHDLTICVVSVPPGSKLSIGAGVKVPARVQITELPVMSIQWWLASAVILTVLLTGLLVLLWRKVRRHA